MNAKQSERLKEVSRSSSFESKYFLHYARHVNWPFANNFNSPNSDLVKGSSVSAK